VNVEANTIKAYIKQNLREHERVLQPNRYLLNGDSLDLSYVVGYLQGRLRSALFFFLNGTYWNGNSFSKADLPYPFLDRVEPFVRNLFFGLKPIVQRVAERFCVFEEFNRRLNGMNEFRVSKPEVAALFRAFYREFEKLAPSLETIGRTEVSGKGVVEENDYPLEDKEYTSPLFELQEFSERYFKGLLKGFYLHGSLSTMDYIPFWSDLDTFMVVKKETILEPGSLLELRKRSIQSHKYLYRVDPHQLHGHLLVSEFDLDYYPQTFFPTILFDYSKSLFDENEPMRVTLRNCDSERLASFWHDAVYYFLERAVNFDRASRVIMLSRERKLFFHRLLTFPLFYLQAKGIHVYKKYSFEAARPEFAGRDWDVIEEATSIMEGWGYHYKTSGNLRTLGSLLPKAHLLIINKYYDIKYRFIDGPFKTFQEHYGRWLSSASRLSIAGWDNVLRTPHGTGTSD
jgi:hypothetical protein